MKSLLSVASTKSNSQIFDGVDQNSDSLKPLNRNLNRTHKSYLPRTLPYWRYYTDVRTYTNDPWNPAYSFLPLCRRFIGLMRLSKIQYYQCSVFTSVHCDSHDYLHNLVRDMWTNSMGKVNYFNPDFLSHLFSFDRKACEETGFTKFTVVHGWNRIHGWAYLWHRSIESNPMVNFGELYIKVFIIKWSQIVWIVKLLIFTRYRMLSGPRNYFLN